MKIYNYDKDGLFTYSEDAFLDPEESKKQGKNVYLLPNDATFISPPKTDDDEVAVFNDKNWDIVKNYVGKKQINIITQEIAEVKKIGELPKDCHIITDKQIEQLNAYTKAIWEDDALVIKKSLPEFKLFKRTEINQARDLAEQGGFEYLGRVFDSDPISVQRMTLADNAALKSKMAGVPFSIEWTCKDNSKILLNEVEMLGMLPALTAYANELHTKASTLKSLIDKAETVEELEAIVWER